MFFAWVRCVGVVAAQAACSVDSVTFMPGGDPADENCAAEGDEDGNGLADCGDPACAGVPACPARPVCGNDMLEAGEACDDGSVVVVDGCRRSCETGTIAYLKASNTSAGDLFGYSVALSADGSTLAVGAYEEASSATGVGGNQTNDLAPTAGAVYVYTRSGGVWNPQAYIKATNTNPGDRFGHSVALSADGSMLAVSAYGEASNATGVGGNQDNDSSPLAGAVYVYTRNSTVWSPQAYVKATNTRAGDRFGFSVALSADSSTLAVGAVGEPSGATGVGGSQSDNSAPFSGAVYVYARSDTTWSPQAYVKATNTDGNDGFGSSVALSANGSTLAVSAYEEASNAIGVGGNQTNNSAPSSGAVYVYTRSGTTWSPQAYVKATNTQADDDFGRSVALSGDGATLAVGAIFEDSGVTGVGGDQADESASGSGAVYVYARNGTAWSPQAYVKASNTGANDFFGWNVALSADGSALAVSAAREEGASSGFGGSQGSNGAMLAGAAYTFARTSTAWNQRAYVKASNTDMGDEFGRSLALSADGATLAIGAIFEASSSIGVGGSQGNNDAPSAGAVYVFE